MTAQLQPPTIGDVVSAWIADVAAVHRRIDKVLQDPRVRAGMPPRMRDTLEELLAQLRHCQMNAPTPAMIRGWARTLEE